MPTIKKGVKPKKKVLTDKRVMKSFVKVYEDTVAETDKLRAFVCIVDKGDYTRKGVCGTGENVILLLANAFSNDEGLMEMAELAMQLAKVHKIAKKA